MDTSSRRLAPAHLPGPLQPAGRRSRYLTLLFWLALPGGAEAADRAEDELWWPGRPAKVAAAPTSLVGSPA